METKWLEDFVSLAETRSFSRSAQLRHVTQPAFSRRIQSLEAWAGTDLVDRSAYPTRLTAAGETLHAQAMTGTAAPRSRPPGSCPERIGSNALAAAGISSAASKLSLTPASASSLTESSFCASA